MTMFEAVISVTFPITKIPIASPPKDFRSGDPSSGSTLPPYPPCTSDT